jgi:antitoxin component YwqK of YwqJK toxin-antitoxin module
MSTSTIEITYKKHSNTVDSVAELNEHGQRNGLYANWFTNGLIWEESYWKNGEAHGPYKYWSSSNQLTRTHHVAYYYNGLDITPIIKPLVKDLFKITPDEKTFIALHTGYIL